MAKTNRFQLEMEDGILVNTLRELKEHFSLEKVQDYARNGQLAEWLDARYEEELADEVRALDEYRADFAERLCKLFGVEYSAAVEDSEEAAVCREKRERLMAYGADAKFFEVLDNIAFTQDDLYDLLDKDITSIYLCGEEFEIPINRRGTAYVGVNEPTVIIHSKKLIDWEERDISFTDVKFDEEYQALVLKNAPCGAPKEGLETLTIDDDLTVHRGEEKVFSSKELYLNSNIECDGSLFFEQSLIHIGDESRISCHGAIRFVNCTLLYTREYSTGGEIVIESSSEFELINCIVEAEEEVENKCEYSDERKVLFYIYGNNYSSGQPKNKYNISRCCFIDCASTFTAEDHTGTLHFDNCSIVNPGRWFVYTDNYTDYIEMDTTVITFNEQLLYSEYTRPVVKAKMLTLRNCKFNGNNSDEGVWFYQGKECNTTNCEFHNLNGRDGTSILNSHGHIHNSFFSSCANILSGADVYDKEKKSNVYNTLNNCRFDNCTDIFSTSAKADSVSYCQFNDCINTLIRMECFAPMISNCEFNNLTCTPSENGIPSAMFSGYGLEKEKSNDLEVSNCIFHGIRANDSYVVNTEYFHISTCIHDCTFKNCRTWDNKDELIPTQRRTKIYGRPTALYNITIENCTGLDKVNKEPDTRAMYTPKNTDTDGNPIGVTVELNTPEIPAFCKSNRQQTIGGIQQTIGDIANLFKVF